jgi:RNA polymerase sigma-70 factor (ECF subfamily)
MIPTDQVLLERALEGDEGAYTALYRLRQGAVYRFALHMSGSAAMAEDVTQDTFLEILRGGRKYDAARGTLRSFLFGVARNFVLRRIGRGREEPLEEDATDGLPSKDTDILRDLTRRETIEQVRCAVLTLPPAYREAVVLCDLEEASYEDAAVALDCPVGTVRSRLSRARAMLASKLRGIKPSGVKGGCHV